MENLNELLMWWALWVDSNVDILIMTITLIVVAGLVLEVVRLRKSINTQVVDLWNDNAETYNELCGIEGKLRDNITDQVQVNINIAKDIVELQKKLKTKKK